MRKGMYLRLAVTNLVKNRKIYVPYLLTCICSIAMFYIMRFIRLNPGVEQMRGGSSVRMVLGVGLTVLMIFSVIFLIYSNGFLMRSRKKELGLYNILGMEKRHIARMLVLELLITALVSICLGICLGILGSKLMFMLLLRLIRMPVTLGFYISGKAIQNTLQMFLMIYLLTLLNDLRQIHLVNPIELLRSASEGEKEPKAKWLMAAAGMLCLGVGYYLAWTTESPLRAVNIFFLAVLLVMAGTYLLFTAGSIAILKLLKSNKKFYYQTRHFTSVSGLIYRMKQNAVGLANICILSTGVLLVVSTTVCLYFGTEDSMEMQYPSQINVTVQNLEPGTWQSVQDQVEKTLRKAGVTGNVESETFISEIAVQEDDTLDFVASMAGKNMEGMRLVYLFTQDEYERITGRRTKPLEDGELLYLPGNQDSLGEMVGIGDRNYELHRIEPFSIRMSLGNIIESVVLIGNEDVCERIGDLCRENLGDMYSGWNCELGVDLKEACQEEDQVGNQILADLKSFVQQSQISSEEDSVSVQLRQENEERIWELNGGLFFLGIFMGLLFLLSTTLIIYYKQVSEGYEDRERYEIMQKVGMSKREVQKSVQSQILLVFFLPLLMAVCHIVAAFQLVRRLMAVLYIMNTQLFVLCMAATVLVFALVYTFIYWVTARVYYKIIE